MPGEHNHPKKYRNKPCYNLPEAHKMQTVTIQLPDDQLKRYRRSAKAAGKPLETFLAERLSDTLPPLTEKSSETQNLFRAMERMDTNALVELTKRVLSPDEQDLYEELLAKNSQGPLNAVEQAQMKELGDKARNLTLQKSHAYLILKWRGYPLPFRQTLLEQE